MKALVLSGGGSNGSYSLGVIQGLYAAGNRYDMFCGVSVGALICAHLSQAKSGQEAKNLAYLLELFLTVRNRDIYKHWFPLAWLHGLWRKSLYNSKPLKKLVDELFDRERVMESEKYLSVGATELKTGRYCRFDESDQHIKDAVLASASFPFMFNPVKIMKQWWVDGGVREVTPLQDAIDRGATEIDVIICTPPEPPERGRLWNALQIGMRAIKLLGDEVARSDIQDSVKRYPGVKIRVWRLQKTFVKHSLDFDPKVSKKLYFQGLADFSAQPNGQG